MLIIVNPDAASAEALRAAVAPDADIVTSIDAARRAIGEQPDIDVVVVGPGADHLSARYPRGVFRGPAGVMHVSPGLGTTFVPFRFFARPEATELVLRRT